MTPLQRPESLGDQAFLTEEEAAAIEQRVVEANARANAPSAVRTEPLPVGGNVGGYNAFWLDRGTTVVPTRRTSLVVDPPDGRLPALTPEAEAHVNSAARQRLKAIREGLVPADSHEQFDYGDRCIWYRGVPSLPTAYNNNYHIVQTEDVIAILQEHIHDVRFIYLDDRPLFSESIAQFGGHSRGRWEGDTLVVETTRFGERAYLFSSGPGVQGGINWDLSPELSVVERFTRVAPGILGLRVHADRSQRLDASVDRLVALGAERPADVRVRLPRGQLRPLQHPGRLARGGGPGGRPVGVCTAGTGDARAPARAGSQRARQGAPDRESDPGVRACGPALERPHARRAGADQSGSSSESKNFTMSPRSGDSLKAMPARGCWLRTPVIMYG